MHVLQERAVESPHVGYVPVHGAPDMMSPLLTELGEGFMRGIKAGFSHHSEAQSFKPDRYEAQEVQV